MGSGSSSDNYRWLGGPAVFGLEAQGDWASLRNSHVNLVNSLLTDSFKVTTLSFEPARPDTELPISYGKWPISGT